MNLIRLLVIAGIIWLVYRMYQNWAASQQRLNKKNAPQPIKKMVRCHTCGVHIPEQGAITSKNLHYCCTDHRDQTDA